MRCYPGLLWVLCVVFALLLPRAVHCQEDGTPRLSTVRQAYELMSRGDIESAREKLQKLAETYDEDASLQYDLALTYYLEKNYFWAQRHLMQALELDDEYALCHRLLALVLARTGEWGDAGQAMARYRELGGVDVSGWAELIEGVAAYKSQDLDGALAHFTDLPEGSAPTILEAGRLYRDTIVHMKGARYPPFEGYVGMGVNYDSNVRLDAMDDPGLGATTWYDPFSRQQSASMGLNLQASLVGRPVRGKLVLEGWGRFGKSAYFKERAGDFDMTMAAAGVRIRIPMLAELDAGYDFNLLILGRGKDFWGPMFTGDARVANPDFYVFQELHGLHVAAQFAPHANVRLNPRYILAYKFHELSRQDIMQHQVDLGVAWFLLGKKLRLYATPFFFANLVIGPDAVPLVSSDPGSRPLMNAYDAWGLGVRLRASYALPHRLSLSGGWSAVYTDYYHSRGDFSGILKVRKDTMLGFNLGLAWSFVDSMSAGLGYRFFRSISSIPDYDYPRHIIDFLNVTWRFGR